MEKMLAERDIGEKYIGSRTRLITPTELDIFCTTTGMRGDAFLSDEVARSRGMKSRVLPGAMSLAILFSLLEEEFLRGPHGQGALFTGLNNLKLLAPVYPHDRLKAETEVLAKKETSKGDRVFVTYAWALKNQEDVVVAKGENT
jgi:acyl dehydratase